MHPKLYLKFLCSPDNALGDVYREAKGGAKALERLAWKDIGEQPAHMQSARALLSDIADYLGCPAPVPEMESPETSRHTQRQQRVLRNL